MPKYCTPKQLYYARTLIKELNHPMIVHASMTVNQLSMRIKHLELCKLNPKVKHKYLGITDL